MSGLCVWQGSRLLCLGLALVFGLALLVGLLLVMDFAHSPGVALADGDISIDPEPSAGPPAQSGDAIRVGVEFQFDTIMGGLVGIDNITLRSATEMKVFGVES